MATIDSATGSSLHRALAVWGGSDIGSKRAQNQDVFVITDLASVRTGGILPRMDVFRSRPGVLQKLLHRALPPPPPLLRLFRRVAGADPRVWNHFVPF